MAKRKPLIPFKWLPASWGLKGKPFEIAKANYELDGEDLERVLIQINYGEEPQVVREQTAKMLHRLGKIDDRGLDQELAEAEYGTGKVPPAEQLALDLTHGVLSQYDYEVKMAALKHPDIESLNHKVAMLEIDYNHDKIDRNTFEKTVANLRNEPWVGIIDQGFKPEEGLNGVYFEFDWNPQWVEFLQKNGYHGKTEEEIVEQWFSHVCRVQTEDTPVEDAPVPFNSGRVINRVRGNDGRTGFY